ncbi:MAG: ParB/RepB/Spo0J family partition protein [Oscillospiraceae bacterium]|nr:ParB/RepB/Spo0J family partition protein [Oscillospiraceae bacterium]
MANTSRGLGKGLSALLGEDALKTEPSDNIKVPITQIENNLDQPRRHFDEESLSELADSIREHGLLQPINVRRLSGGSYQIIAGERRWRAARLAGLTEVPVIIIEADDRKAMEIALIENLQREDLDPIEEAEGYRRLMDSYQMTQEEVAQRVGKSRSAVANALRLLGLCPEVRELLERQKLSSGHARALLTLNATLQKKAAQRVVDGGLSVRQTEALVKKLSAKEKTKTKKDDLSVDYIKLAANDLTETIGRGCRIVPGRKKGRIELEYYGVDDLNDLLDALKLIKKRGGK